MELSVMMVEKQKVDEYNTTSPLYQSSLPQGWKKIRLSKVLKQIERKEEINPNKYYTRLGVKWYAEGPFTKEKVLGSEIKSKYLYRVESGDFIYNRLFAWKGSFCIIPESMTGCYVSNEFPVFEVNQNEVDPSFLWRYFSLPYIWKSIENRSTGSTSVSRLRFKEKDLLNLEIPQPPIAEQKAMTCILNSIQSSIFLKKYEMELSREFTSSLIEHIFKYGIKDEPRKQTTIGEVPESWQIISLNEITCEFISGGTPSTKERKYWDGTIPWTTSAQINEHDVTLNMGQKFISKDGLDNSASHLVPKGSLLVGTRVGVGKAAVNIIDIAISQDLTGLVLNKSVVNPIFIAYEFKTNYVQSYLERRKRGTTIKGISRSDLHQLILALPPLDVQNEIVNIINTCNIKNAALVIEVVLQEDFFNSMLYKLFSGQFSSVPLLKEE